MPTGPSTRVVRCPFHGEWIYRTLYNCEKAIQNTKSLLRQTGSYSRIMDIMFETGGWSSFLSLYVVTQ